MNTLEQLDQMVEACPQWEPPGNENEGYRCKSGIVLPHPAYVPFPSHLLPEPVRDYIVSGSKAIGCDPAYLALPMLAALAVAIGNTRRISLKKTWSEPCVIWTAIVGRSGTHKSPAQEISLRVIKTRQEQALLAHMGAIKDHHVEMEIYERAKAQWKKKKAQDDDPPPEKPVEPTAERIIVSDVTTEALAPLLQENPRGLLLVRDELAGWFGSFDQYRGGRGGDVAHWLEMHRAGSLTVDRKGGEPRTIYVPNSAVSITGGIQPETLKDALGRDYFENGLAARLLLSMPPIKKREWSEEEIDPALEQRLEETFGRLFSLEFRNLATREAELIPLSKAGKAVWVKFYNEHAREQMGLENDLFAVWSKLEGYAARFALVTHLVRWAEDDPTLADEGEVDERSVEAGIELARWFGDEAKRIYAMMSESEQAQSQRELIELIQWHGGTITARELMHASRQYRDDVELAEKALLELKQAGHGDWEVIQAERGRPKRMFHLN